MTKRQAIVLINRSLGEERLNPRNTHWSNVVEYRSEQGWWLNIPFPKFSQDLNIILNSEQMKVFLHIVVPANSVIDPKSEFRNKEGAADIFMPNIGTNQLIDTQSGSGRHNFGIYPSKEYSYATAKLPPNISHLV